MKEQKHDTWYLPRSIKLESVTDTVSSKFTFKIEQSQKELLTCFDTFDWQLYRHGCYLQYSSGAWLLTRGDNTKTVESENGSTPGKRIFSWDFPHGKLRSSLKSMLKNRALLPLATVDLITTPVRVLNKDGDAIGLLLFKSQQMHETENILGTVRLYGVPGYGKQTKSIRSLLRSHGIVERVSLLHDFEKRLKGSGRTPGDYTSKFSIELNPDDTAGQAAVTIYKKLLGTMIRNEEGIIDDLDSEFLHDFRVALRRTRSGLSQMKNILPPEVSLHFKKEFSYIGDITGPTRDLDVYLLYEDKYKSRLPPTLQVALHTFFSDLTKRRSEEQKKLIRALKATRYKRIISEWRQYLEDGIPVAGHDVPVMDLARKTISRQYKKIIKNGMVITPSTPDENLHRLRIQCKKLRYSLEFFASLFPKTKINRLIKQLKRLQNNLGHFNDLSVEQDMLHQYLKGLRPGLRKNIDLATAIGGLLTTLHHEQHQVREDFFSAFQRFSSRKNRVLLNKLFN